MKPSELRIGNWVSRIYFGYRSPDEDAWGDYEWKVTDYREFDNEESTECFRPIPLTEEWLVKFGLEDGNGHYFKRINHAHYFIVAHDRNGWFLCDIDLTVIIKHVHQLQNLYFALTGDELTLTK